MIKNSIKNIEKYITFNDKGVATISGTRLRVIDLVETMQEHRCDINELKSHYPYYTDDELQASIDYYHVNK